MYHVDGEVNHKEKTMADICLEKNDLLLLLLQMPMFKVYDAAINSPGSADTCQRRCFE